MAKVALTTKQKLEKIMSNFPDFSKNFIWIIDNNGNKVRLELNEQQQEFHELVEDNRFTIVAKARQGGFSTYAIARAIYQAITKADSNILMVSYKHDSSKALFEKLKKMNRDLDQYRSKYNNNKDKYGKEIIFPETVRDNRDELLLSNGSKIVCIVAGNKDIGRGETYSLIHLSEYAFWSNQEKQLLASEQALAKGSGRLIIETTSNGYNYYRELFMSAWKGKSKYKPYFVPFYASLYKDQFRGEHDEAIVWFKATNKGKTLSKADLDKDEQLLYNKGANLRFLTWRRWKLQDMSLQDFWQEYPSDPLESFISTGVGVFDKMKLNEQLHYVTSEVKPLSKEQVFSDEFFPEILKPYINKGLYIYDYPKRGKRYLAGIDVASGNGKGDMSTVTVLDEDGDQIASFYRNDVPVYKFTDIVREIGLYFNYAFLCIENNGLGVAVLERLRKQTNEPYLNLYKHRQFIRGQKKPVLGWTATTETIGEATTDLKEQFELGYINIKCKETLEQMQTYTDENKRINGHHNDLVRSLMLAVQGKKQRKYYVEVI